MDREAHFQIWEVHTGLEKVVDMVVGTIHMEVDREVDMVVDKVHMVGMVVDKVDKVDMVDKGHKVDSMVNS